MTLQSAQPAPQSSAPLDLSDFAQVPAFIRECERVKVATKGQILWWLRFRQENGLIASGAVVEKRANPRSKRPVLYVVRPKFLAWLASTSIDTTPAAA